jgi:ribonuclease III
LTDWLAEALGSTPGDLSLYERALTHGSHVGANYERLEFLGDRVLGLIIAEWLYERFPDDAEGLLSVRLNAMVSRASCAVVGRSLDLKSRMRLGKQALEDGAFESDNVLGDVVEALIGATFLDLGLEAARTFIRKGWAELIDGQAIAQRHPKSALQEWAAAQSRKPPVYEVLDRYGPDHAPRFRVKVSLGSAGEADAEGASKQEAETAAALALLGILEA